MEIDQNYFKLELTGNKRTRSCDQIEEWISPQVEEMQKKMTEWDWSKPFTLELQEKGSVVEYDNLLKDNGLPDKLPGFGYFKLFDSSKLTDFVRGSFLDQYGLIVSKGAKEILEKFNIGVHNFYNLTLKHKDFDYDEYFFFKSLTNSNSYIDIEKSSFYTEHGFFNPDSKKKISFKTYDDIKEFRAKNVENKLHVLSDSIQLKTDFPKFDYFAINEFGIYEKFISERLAKELNTKTGINMIQTEIINK